MKTIAYHNRKLRIISALVASVYILFHGRPINLIKAFSSPGFYLALVINFSISMILVQIIHIITLWLDKRSDWRSEPIKRALLQFLLGVILPVTADLMLVSTYFHAQRQNMIDNKFLLIDFPVIVFFIVLMNLYYLVHYLLLTEAKPMIQTQYIAETNPISNKNTQDPETTTTLIVDYNGQHLQFDVVEDILCFYRLGRLIKAFTTHGNEYVINITLATLEEQFRAYNFCKINRSMIINCRTIRGYTSTEKRDNFKIIFKPQFTKIGTLDDKNFYITREYLTVFREIFDHL